MRVLALDTATEACSVALLTDDGYFRRFEEVGRSHAEVILEMVHATLAEAGIRLDILDGIAASVGPGSFTGVRLGVSVAQGLAFGAELPVIPVTTLEALALQALRGGAQHVMACLDARMSEVYWACFDADAARGVAIRGPMAVGVPAAIEAGFDGPFHGIGRGFAAYPALDALPGLVVRADDRNALPDALDMARLGALRLRAGEGGDPADLVPMYVRDKVALTEAERVVVAAAARAARGG